MPYKDNQSVLLRVFVRESQAMEAIEKLLELGFEGATVIRGIMGYGKTGQPLSEDITIESLELPAVVEIVTTFDRFLKHKETLKKIFEGVITLERAEKVL